MMSKRRRSGQSKWILRSFDTLAKAFHPTRHRSIACIMCHAPKPILTKSPSPAAGHHLQHRLPVLQQPYRTPIHQPNHQPLSANSATHELLLPTEQIKTETVQKTTTEGTNQHPLQLLHRPRDPLPQRSKNRLRLLDRSFLFPANASARQHTLETLWIWPFFHF